MNTMSDMTLKVYKQQVKEKLHRLSTIFANASAGDFSEDIVILPKEDEFTPLYIGIQVMLEVIREQLAELQNVDRKKTEFLSMTAHQLRTPLGSIRWYIETLLHSKRYDVPEPVREKLKYIHECNLRMIFFVNDLLNVSRIDQNHIVDEPQNTNIVEIIKRLAEDLQYEIKNKALQYSLKSDPATNVVVDPHHFREVMYNLFSNAIKYNAQGGLVTITIKEIPSFLQIQVADTGIGVPENECSRIFEKFFRASNAILQDTQSTGLGLFIVKSYVERWHGTVNFESILGKGSTFVITIPL